MMTISYNFLKPSKCKNRGQKGDVPASRRRWHHPSKVSESLHGCPVMFDIGFNNGEIESWPALFWWDLNFPYFSYLLYRLHNHATNLEDHQEDFRLGCCLVFLVPSSPATESRCSRGYAFKQHYLPKDNYTFRRVDGPALFQSARIDGADFLNFDTRKGRGIHPPYFCGPPSMPECVANVFQGCAIYAGGKGKEKGERGQGRGKGKEKGKEERERDSERRRDSN